MQPLSCTRTVSKTISLVHLLSQIQPLSYTYWLKCNLSHVRVLTQIQPLPYYWHKYNLSCTRTDSNITSPVHVLTQIQPLPYTYWLKYNLSHICTRTDSNATFSRTHTLCLCLCLFPVGSVLAAHRYIPIRSRGQGIILNGSYICCKIHVICADLFVKNKLCCLVLKMMSWKKTICCPLTFDLNYF